VHQLLETAQLPFLMSLRREPTTYWTTVAGQQNQDKKVIKAHVQTQVNKKKEVKERRRRVHLIFTDPNYRWMLMRLISAFLKLLFSLSLSPSLFASTLSPIVKLLLVNSFAFTCHKRRIIVEEPWIK